MALLWQLVKNGTLEKGSVLFWDEPEANINPLYIGIIVDMLLELQRKEVQIFIATHDYMLASYFEVRKKERDDILYHSLSHNKENMLLEYEKWRNIFIYVVTLCQMFLPLRKENCKKYG